MFSLRNGSFPLFVPGFAGGQSAAALTVGQLYHPISYLTSILPGYWTGKALEWNTFFRLLSLGFAQLGLFVFLKKIKINTTIAFIVTTSTAYHLRMLDLFRYGVSFEAWTGHLFLCTAIGFLFLNHTKYLNSIIVIISTYWLVCSGHPQNMYYGLIGAGMFTLILPFFLKQIQEIEQFNTKVLLKFWGQTFLLTGIGVLLSSIYILPFYYDFLSLNVERVAKDYSWANKYLDTFIGTLNNFFYPFRADVHSAFSGSSLFLMPVMIPLLHFFRIKIPTIIWIIWFLIVLSFLHMQGDRLPIHYLVWKYFPLASSFRVAGRISLIIPILFMFSLLWILSLKNNPITSSIIGLTKSPPRILSLLALIVMGIYYVLPDNITYDVTVFSPVNFREIPTWIEKGAYFLGFVLLSLMFIYWWLPNHKYFTGPLLCVAVCAQIMILLQYGTWIEKKVDTITYEKMADDIKKDFTYNYYLPGYGMSTDVTLRQAELSFLEPFLGKFYRKWLYVESNKKAYAQMAERQSPEQIIIEAYPPYHDFSIDESKSTNTNSTDHIRLLYSSFNKLIFKTNTQQPGYFGMAFPYTEKWKAFLNNKETRIFRANGASHAVAIPAGKNRVEFRYWSQSTFIGMILSIVTLSFIGLYFAFKFQNTAVIAGMLLLTLLLCVTGFVFWKNSIYKGNNLNAIYSWQAPPHSSYDNIAYGKRTQMSSIVNSNYPYLSSSGKAVDGNHSQKTGFITNNEKNPFWMIDLHHPQEISCIMVYETPSNTAKLNLRPIVVSFSNDGNTWREIPVGAERIVLNLDKTVIARYVRFTASGTCYLSFDEVEIYQKPLKQIGEKYFQNGQYDEAIFFCKKSFEINPDDPDIFYRLACIFSKQKKIKVAIQMVGIAIQKGYDKPEELKFDNNLQNIHDNPNFIKLLTISSEHD